MRHRNRAMLLPAMIAALAVAMLVAPTLAAQPKSINVKSLRLAVEDLEQTHGPQYPGEKFSSSSTKSKRRWPPAEKTRPPSWSSVSIASATKPCWPTRC